MEAESAVGGAFLYLDTARAFSSPVGMEAESAVGGAFLYLDAARAFGSPVGMEAESAVGGAFLYLDAARAFSSVGRAPPLQGGGRGIKTLNAHSKVQVTALKYACRV